MTPSPKMWECGKGATFSIFPHREVETNTGTTPVQKYSHKNKPICLIQKKLDIDRLTHNAHLIVIEGDSYRKRKGLKKNKPERH
jgi:hypothetical protein